MYEIIFVLIAIIPYCTVRTKCTGYNSMSANIKNKELVDWFGEREDCGAASPIFLEYG